MAYQKTSSLPESVKNHLPRGAQKIYLEAYNSAFEEYKSPSKRRGDSSREETARKVAWSAVKKKYKKKEDGKWIKK